MVNGLDISDFQASISLPTMHAAGYSFAYIKATQSTNYVSPSFAAQFQSAGGAGMLRGGYHYYIFNQDPQQQAQLFLKTCPPVEGALPPAVDIEMDDQGTFPPPNQNVANLSAFLHTVEAATGVKCMLYVNFDGWSQLLGGTTGFSGHPFWVPSYLSGVTGPPPQGQPPIMQPPPPQITAWSNWTIWQYTSSGQVSGFGGALDLDVYNGSLAQLQALCQK